MKRGSTWFLRGVILFMGLVALVVCVFGLPSMLEDASQEFPGADTLLYIFIGGLYLSAVPFFIALYQSIKLLNFIDKNTAFSQASVKALNVIKYCGIGVSVSYAATIPYLFYVAQIDDAPGVGALALAFVCVPLAVTTFAAVLEMLLQNAIDIKSENDLTV